MLLSDHDIKLELDAGRIGLDPYEPTLIQPSSIDVRLDRLFRLFDNHKYPFIDPAADQPELTRLVVEVPQVGVMHAVAAWSDHCAVGDEVRLGLDLERTAELG